MQKSSTLALLVASAAAAAFVACTAQLEVGCLDGGCETSVTVSTGTGPECEFTEEETQGLPCDVFKVLETNCHACHNNEPDAQGPFPLLTYDDTQQPYGPALRWNAMQRAIQPGAGAPAMPLNGNPPGITQAELDVMNAWFATCEAGMCEKRPGGGGSGGGGGGGGGGSTTGGTTTSSTTSATTSGGGMGGAGGN